MIDAPPKVDNPEPEPRSARARRIVNEKIRLRMDAELAAHGEYRLPVIARSILEEMANDAAFLRAWWMETSYQAVYESCRLQAAQTRARIKTHQEITVDGETVVAPIVAFPFNKWVEHADDAHKSLMKMTREDLLIAARERESRGMHELRLAMLWRELANGMRANQTVEEVYTEEQINEIERSLSPS